MLVWKTWLVTVCARPGWRDTLSRIERDKQRIDLELFLSLTKILKAPPQDLLGEGNGSDEIDDPSERARLWRELTNVHRSRRPSRRVAQIRHVAQQVEELLAQLECMPVEIEAVYKRLRRV